MMNTEHIVGRFEQDSELEGLCCLHLRDSESRMSEYELQMGDIKFPMSEDELLGLKYEHLLRDMEFQISEDEQN